MSNSTDIQSLMNDMNSLDEKESSMVDSIINDLNSTKQPQQSQQKMPQITDEEREMLIRQQKQEMMQKQKMQQQQMMMAQQQMAQQQMAQQQMAQQQMATQQQMAAQKQLAQQMENQNDLDSDDLLSKIRNKVMTNYKEIILVFILSIVFNIPQFEKVLLFNEKIFMNDGTVNIVFTLFKALLVTIIYFGVKLVL